MSRFRLTMAFACWLLLAGLSAGRLAAAEISLTLQAEEAGQPVNLGERQAIWQSPFGGWVLESWPFSMQVNQQPIMVFQAPWQRLLAKTPTLDATAHTVPDGLDEDKSDPVLALKLLRAGHMTLDRRARVTLNLGTGDHVLQPGTLKFQVQPGGLVKTEDARLQVAADGKGLILRLYPVTVLAEAGSEVVPQRWDWRLGASDLLAKLTEALADANSNPGTKGPAAEDGVVRFRRLRLWVPPSGEEPYRLNGFAFTVSPKGELALAADSRERLALREPATVVVRLPALTTANTTPLGVAWQGLADDATLSAGDSNLALQPALGSGVLACPLAAFGAEPALVWRHGKAQVKLNLPVRAPAWPYPVLVLDGASDTAWWLASAALTVAPGATWRMQILALAGQPVPASLPGYLLPRGGAGPGRPLVWQKQGKDVYEVALPGDLAPGLYQWLPAAPWPGAGLAILPLRVGVAVEGALSVFTWRNRGVFRVGDEVGLHWVLRPGAGALPAQAQVTLTGAGLSLPLATLPLRAETLSGAWRLATAALPPGDYQVHVAAGTLAGWGTRFRLVQREPKTDFNLYAHYPFAEMRPHGGLPLVAYLGQGGFANEPGLLPWQGVTRGGWEASWASFSGAPDGPALELCLPPEAEDQAFMALAAMGAKATPGLPQILHHEEWNPKHTLPEELASLRRRLSLISQRSADVAGYAGVRLNWYATLGGYWEESKPLDGHQTRRNAAANAWIGQRAKELLGPTPAASEAEQKNRQAAAGYTARGEVLPNAYAAWLAGALRLKPDFESHSGIPSFWLAGGQSHPAVAWHSLTHRDAVDYTDYGRSPWGEFRAPAFMALGNLKDQPIQCAYMTYGRHSRFLVAFGATGRGMDGWALAPDDPLGTNEDLALLRIFERFGGWLRTLKPKVEVAVYCSPASPWNNQKSVILHDLARLGRPGMLLGPEEILAGGLKDVPALLLAAVGEGEPPALLAEFARYEKAGGLILKDPNCATSLPGKVLGFAYDDSQVHKGWGLAYPNGEWEFAVLWHKFVTERESHLRAAFATLPPPVLRGPDAELLLSPLVGEDSMVALVSNMLSVPMSVEGKWRQHAVLPRIADMQVAAGWQVHDLLTGQPVALTPGANGASFKADFTRAEGRLYLLTKRATASFQASVVRPSATLARLTGEWRDATGKALADPVPVWLSLRGPEGVVVLEKFAAIGPQHPLEFSVPALAAGAKLALQVRDLVTGQQLRAELDPAPAPAALLTPGEDLIAPGLIRDFLQPATGEITILLSEAQAVAYQPAAEAMLALLKAQGRQARIQVLDRAEVRTITLRWQPVPADTELLTRLQAGSLIGWRQDLAPYTAMFDDPECGYSEYGPRLWLKGPVLLIGTPAEHPALADLTPWLRRVPTANYPAPNGFFVHFLADPFEGGSDGLYFGCRTPAGAMAAVRFLEGWLKTPPAAEPASALAASAAQALTPAPATEPLPDMLKGQIGSRVLDLAWSPSGSKLVATADTYGEAFFIFNATGELQGKRVIGNRAGNNIWYRQGGGLRVVDEQSLFVRVGGHEVLMDLDKGFQGRAHSPPNGLPGRTSAVPKDAPTALRDSAKGLAYLGGRRWLNAMNTAGELLWRYDDFARRTSETDLLYRRSLFPRALSPDGAVLLVGAFGIEQDVYGLGNMRNESVFGLDTRNGQVLWERNGLQLNAGKALAGDGRFVVISDDGQVQVLAAKTGQPVARYRPVNGSDWVLAIPGGDNLLVVENGHFDRQGPTGLAYLRSPGDTPDLVLPLGGRITDVALATKAGLIVLSSERGQTAAFTLSGAPRWQVTTPTGGKLAVSPDNQSLAVGTREGTIYLLELASGQLRHTEDINSGNQTTPERFVEQLSVLKDVPEEKAMTVPPLPPAPSYLKTLPKEAMVFGPNLLTPAVLGAALKPWTEQPGTPWRLTEPVSFTLSAKANATYLVEWLAYLPSGSAAPHGRLEVSISGGKDEPNLPVTARLPLPKHPQRQRLAFRTVKGGPITVNLRLIEAATIGEGRQARWSYTPGKVVTDLALAIGEPVLSAMAFPSRNLLEEGEDGKARGNITCEVVPWTGGNSTVRWMPVEAPKASLRLSDGLIARQESHWHEAKEAPTDTGIKFANAWVKLARPQKLAAIAIYEDPSGPVPSKDGVAELVAGQFIVYGRLGKGQWQVIGQVAGNRNLVNIFACDPKEVDEIRYLWANREDGGHDGKVRMIEFEAFTTAAGDIGIDEEF